jgi:cytochrome c oxidase subunit II
MSAPGWDERALQSALDVASPQAAGIRDLWWVFFWVCASVWALVVVITLLALARRRRPHDGSEAPIADAGVEPALTRVTTAAGIATALTLLALLVASGSTGSALARAPSADAVKIRVTGQRWWWLVEYPGAPPSNTVTTANEVHVPVGRDVSIELDSRDVIHSLWVPELQGKRDLIPGHPSELHFVATRPGTYRGQCAEFCGLQHAHMGLLVIAEPADRFEAWLAAQRTPAPPVTPASPGELQRGQQVFLRGSCPVCHGIRGTTASGLVAPDLTHIGSRVMLAAATLPNTPEHLGDWLRDPQRVKLGTLMPPQPLSAQDEEDLMAYLRSLK